jgi:hypothetical protein
MSNDIVYGLHRARGDEERVFLGWALKPRSTVCELFGLKTTQMVFLGLTSKPMVTVSICLASKSVATVCGGVASKSFGRFFIGLCLKTDDDGLWVVWPQNHSDGFRQFDLKLVATISIDLTSKPAATVLASKLVATVSSDLTSKHAATVFSNLGSKLVATVFSSLTSNWWRRFLPF